MTEPTHLSEPSPVARAGLGDTAAQLWRWRRLLGAAAVLAIVALASFAVTRLAKEVSYAQVVEALRKTPWAAVLASVLATIASFAALTVYDVSALRHVGRRAPYPFVALTAFCAYAVGNTAGFGPLTGGAIRYRFYSRAGIEPDRIAKVIAFVTVAFWFGLASVSAIGLLIAAPQISPVLHAPGMLLYAAAAAILLGFIFMFVLAGHAGRTGRGPLSFALPKRTVLAQQLLATFVDVLASAFALWILLPFNTIGFPAFAALYAVAVGLGVLSHVPAGLGVFETIIIASLGAAVPIDQVLGALILYRVIYHVLPLVAAAGLLSAVEVRLAAQGEKASQLLRAGAQLAPPVLGSLAFLAGLMLILSGVTPSLENRLDVLAGILPLPLVESAHFLASVLGLGLIVLARGLVYRLDGAWWAAVLVTALAIVFSLIKAIAVVEALLLAILLGSLLVTRREFSCRAALLHQALSPVWLVAIGTVLITALSVLLFAFQSVQYSDQLWWQFEFRGEAPRSLRALIGITLASGILSIWALLRPTPGKAQQPSDEEIARAVQIVMKQPKPEANLVRTRDTSLLFSDDGRAFIMFGQQARSRIALFDPIGPIEAWPALIWRFVEDARAQNGRAVFYQVLPEHVALYADVGLASFKLGEEARVFLPDFDLKGSKRASLRHALNRADKEGLAFEVLSPDQAAAEFDALRTVSEAWIAHHKAREKRFSLGAFERNYVLSQPVAVLRRKGEILAFATLMLTQLKEEATVDLMRFTPDAPAGTMEFLFMKLIQHFKDDGFRWFNLGMAPLSGLSESTSAPLWDRVGRAVFEHGEALYNFRGLRAFKAKFQPHWRARYLAVSGGLNPALALADVTILISGGFGGIAGK